MSKLLAYLPSFYKEIREFQELSEAVAVEYDAIDQAFERIENDQFVMSSEESGVARREKDFEIVPDLSVESLNFRKRRLLARMQEVSPYVLEYLKELLDNLLGEGASEIHLNTLLFEMEVLIQVENTSFYSEINHLLERIVPLNIIYKLISLIRTDVYFGAAVMVGEEVTLYPWNVTSMDLKATASFGSYTQSFETFTVYPQ